MSGHIDVCVQFFYYFIIIYLLFIFFLKYFNRFCLLPPLMREFVFSVAFFPPCMNLYFRLLS